jgi:hypothetical protein
MSNSDIVDFIYDHLKKGTDLKIIVENLLDKLIATDTFSKIFSFFDNLGGNYIVLRRSGMRQYDHDFGSFPK